MSDKLAWRTFQKQGLHSALATSSGAGARQSKERALSTLQLAVAPRHAAQEPLQRRGEHRGCARVVLPQRRWQVYAATSAEWVCALQRQVATLAAMHASASRKASGQESCEWGVNMGM